MHLPTLYGNEGGYLTGFYCNFNANLQDQLKYKNQ